MNPGHWRPGLARGLSLVELLVALAIGVVLSFAAVNLFLQSKLAFLQDEEMARLQENGRYALRYLARELMMAGYLGTALPGYRVPTRESGTACFEYLMDTATGVESVGDVTADGLGGSGSHNVPTDCRVAGSHLPGTDLLLVRRTGDTPVRYQGVRQGTVNSDDIYLYIAERGGAARLQRGDAGSGEDSWEYLPQVLFIRDYSRDRGDNIPTLCRKQPARSANRMAPTECLIEGIENLQLEFGIDDTGDGQPERFTREADAAAMASAVAARIYLLVRSVYPVAGHVDDKSYALGSTLVPPAGDGYSRRLMQTTVMLRNTWTAR